MTEKEKTAPVVSVGADTEQSILKQINNSITDFNENDKSLDDYFEEMQNSEKEKADITLSGHIHAGQASFFGLFSPFTRSVTRYGEKYRYGMKNFDNHKIYITSGLGGSAFGQYLRFFARPEVVILKLKKIE